MDKINVSEFSSSLKTHSAPKIYRNLTILKYQRDELQEFLNCIPILIKETTTFFHSLEKNDIIFVKQSYEYFKTFVENADEEIITNEKFKILLHKWENAVKCYSLYMPYEAFTDNETNLSNYHGDNELLRLHRILKFKKDIRDNSMDVRTIKIDITRNCRKFQIMPLNTDEKELIDSTSPQRLFIFNLKLLLLALKKHNYVSLTKTLMEKEDIQKFDDVFVLETDTVNDMPVYSIFQLLLFGNSETKIPSKQFFWQRSKNSLLKYFCVFYQIKKNFKANQIKSFMLYTNAGVDSMINNFFKNVDSNILFPKNFYKKKSLEYVIIDDKIVEVRDMLRNSVDMNNLAKKLLNYAANDRKITLNASLLALYHVALINEKVIDKSTSKFHANFLIGGELLTAEANKFRLAFLNEVENIHGKNEEKSLEFIKNITLNLSVTFGSDDKQRVCYTDFEIFGDQINLDDQVNMFIQKFVLAVNQPSELELNEIVECELGKNFLILDAEFISKNTTENTQKMLKEHYYSNVNKTGFEMIENFITKAKKMSSISTLDFQCLSDKEPNSYLQDKLSDFFKSEKLIMYITSSFPHLAEITVRKSDNSHIFIPLSLLRAFFANENSAIVLSGNHLIIRDDEKSRNVKRENHLQLYHFLNDEKIKTKAVIIVPKENTLTLVTEKQDKIEFYNDHLEYEKWLTNLKNYLTVNFQSKKASISDIIPKSEELITSDLLEKLFKGEEIVIGKYSSFTCYYDEKFYVSRSFRKENGYNQESYSEKELLEFDDEPIIIVGPLGMGKTTLLTRLSEMVRQNKTDLKWIVTIELKNYCNLLDTLKFNESDDYEIHFFDSDNEDLDFGSILFQSLLTKSSYSNLTPEENLVFEKKLFQHFYNEGKLCILVDGFEEIPFSYHQKVLHFLKKIIAGSNKLIITTTPEFQHILEYHIETKSYVLKSIESEEFIKKYWDKQHLISSEKADLFYRESESSMIFKQNVLPPGSPLFLSILADYFLYYKTRSDEQEMPKEFHLTDKKLYKPHILLTTFTHNIIHEEVTNLLHTIHYFIEINHSMKLLQTVETEKLLKVYQIIAIQKLLQYSTPQLERLLNVCQVDEQNVEKDLFDNIENYFFINIIDDKIIFTHSIFAEYFAATFLITNLTLSAELFFGVINTVISKNSKIFEFLVLELLDEEKVTLCRILQDTSLLNYAVEQNYENIVKCLITKNYEYYCSFPFDGGIDRTAMQIAAENQRGNLIDILLTPYLLELEEEHFARQNKFLVLKITDYIDDLAISNFSKSTEFEIFKKLLFLRKNVTIYPEIFKTIPKSFSFMVSIGFLYDPQWTKNMIKSKFIKKAIERYYVDYSMASNYFNADIQNVSQDNLKLFLKPTLTLLDLVNKSAYYTDEEKLEVTIALINVGANTATWSYKKQEFDEKCSYITCILEAAIVHDHFNTFKYFLGNYEEIIDYCSLLFVAGKYSQNVFIQYLLENHFDKIEQNQYDFVFTFMESLSNEEIKCSLTHYFPDLKKLFNDKLNLVKAAIKNSFKLSTIINFIEQFMDNNTTQELLDYSLSQKRNEVAYYLSLKYGLKLTEIKFPLHFAVKEGYLELVEILLQQKNNTINAQDEEGKTPLHYVNHNVKIARLLLTHGAVYNSIDYEFKIPIEKICPGTNAYDLLTEVEKAFSLKIVHYNETNIPAIFNARNYKQQTLMHVVLKKGNEDEIKHVIEIYINKCKKYLPYIINSEYVSHSETDGEHKMRNKEKKPLNISIQKNNFEVFKKLLENGAFFDENTKELIKKSDNKDFSSKYAVAIKAVKNDTVLDCQMKAASTLSYLELLKAGIELKIDLSKTFSSKNENLLYCYKKYYEYIVNNDIEGLKSAINDHSSLAVFKYILMANIRDTEGNTLLHHAVKHKCHETALFLLEHGIPYNVINSHGNSAEDLTTDATIKNILHTIKDLFYAVKSKKTRFLAAFASHVLCKDYYVNNKTVCRKTIKNIFLNATQHRNIGCINSTMLQMAAEHDKYDIIEWIAINLASFEKEDFPIQAALLKTENAMRENVVYNKFTSKLQQDLNLAFDMVAHVGIDMLHGKLSSYNAAQKRIVGSKITEVSLNDNAKVNLMFEEFRSKINGKPEKGCIHLLNSDSQEIRKRLFKEGLKCGFKNVEIINSRRALYLHVISQIKFKPLNDDVIWIELSSNYYVWKIYDQKPIFIGEWKADSSKLNELQNIVTESKMNKGPEVVLHYNRINVVNFRKISDCKFFVYNVNPNCWIKGYLEKARITSGDPDFAHLDVENVLDDRITLKLGEKELISFKKYQQLPVENSQKLIRESNSDVLKMSHGLYKKCFELPYQKIIDFTFKIDTNGIYTFTFTNKKQIDDDADNSTAAQSNLLQRNKNDRDSSATSGDSQTLGTQYEDKKSIVIFNLEEPMGNEDERRNSDTNTVTQILFAINVTAADIQKMARCGNSQFTPRRLIVEFATETQQRQVLASAKFLKNYPKWSEVIIKSYQPIHQRIRLKTPTSLEKERIRNEMTEIRERMESSDAYHINYVRCYRQICQNLKKRCEIRNLIFEHDEEYTKFSIRNLSTTSFCANFERNIENQTFSINGTIEINNEHLLGLHDPNLLFELLDKIKAMKTKTKQEITIQQNKIIIKNLKNQETHKEMVMNILNKFAEMNITEILKEFRIQLSPDDCFIFSRCLKVYVPVLNLLLKNNANVIRLAICYFKCFSTTPICCRMQSLASDTTINVNDMYSFLHIQKHKSNYLQLSKMLYPFISEIADEILQQEYLEIIPTNIIRKKHPSEIIKIIQKIRDHGIEVTPLWDGTYRVSEFFNFTVDTLINIDDPDLLKNAVRLSKNCGILRQEDFTTSNFQKYIECKTVTIYNAKVMFETIIFEDPLPPYSIKHLPKCEHQSCNVKTIENLILITFEGAPFFAVNRLFPLPDSLKLTLISIAEALLSISSSQFIVPIQFATDVRALCLPNPYRVQLTYSNLLAQNGIYDEACNDFVKISDSCFVKSNFFMDQKDRYFPLAYYLKHLKSEEGISLSLINDTFETAEFINMNLKEWSFPENIMLDEFYTPEDDLKLFLKTLKDQNLRRIPFRVTDKGFICFDECLKIRPTTFLRIKNITKFLATISLFCETSHDEARIPLYCSLSTSETDAELPKHRFSYYIRLFQKELVETTKLLNTNLKNVPEEYFTWKNFNCFPLAIMLKMNIQKILYFCGIMKENKIGFRGVIYNGVFALIFNNVLKADVRALKNAENFSQLLADFEDIMPKFHFSGFLNETKLYFVEPAFMKLSANILMTDANPVDLIQSLKNIKEIYNKKLVETNVTLVENGKLWINSSLIIIPKFFAKLFEEDQLKMLKISKLYNEVFETVLPDNWISLENENFTSSNQLNVKEAALIDTKQSTYFKIIKILHPFLNVIEDDDLVNFKCLKLLPQNFIVSNPNEILTKLHFLNNALNLTLTTTGLIQVECASDSTVMLLTINQLSNVKDLVKLQSVIYQIQALNKYLKNKCYLNDQYLLDISGMLCRDREYTENVKETTDLKSHVKQLEIFLNQNNGQLECLFSLNSKGHCKIGNFVTVFIPEMSPYLHFIYNIAITYDEAVKSNTDNDDIMKSIFDLPSKDNAIIVARKLNPLLNEFSDITLGSENLETIPLDMYNFWKQNSNDTFANLNAALVSLNNMNILWDFTLNGCMYIQNCIMITITQLLNIRSFDEFQKLIDYCQKGIILFCEERNTFGHEQKTFFEQLPQFQEVENAKNEADKIFKNANRIGPNGFILFNRHIWVNPHVFLNEKEKIRTLSEILNTAFARHNFRFVYGNMYSKFVTSVSRTAEENLYDNCRIFCKLIKEYEPEIDIKYYADKNKFLFNECVFIPPEAFFHLQNIREFVNALKGYSKRDNPYKERIFTSELGLDKMWSEMEEWKIQKKERTEYLSFKIKCFKKLSDILKKNKEKIQPFFPDVLQQINENEKDLYGVENITVNGENIFTKGYTSLFVKAEKHECKLKFSGLTILVGLKIAAQLEEKYKCKSLSDFASLLEFLNAFYNGKRIENNKIKLSGTRIRPSTEDDLILSQIMDILKTELLHIESLQFEYRKKHIYRNELKALHHWFKHGESFNSLEDYYSTMNKFFEENTIPMLVLDTQDGFKLIQKFKTKKYFGVKEITVESDQRAVATFFQKTEQEYTKYDDKNLAEFLIFIDAPSDSSYDIIHLDKEIMVAFKHPFKKMVNSFSHHKSSDIKHEIFFILSTTTLKNHDFEMLFKTLIGNCKTKFINEATRIFFNFSNAPIMDGVDLKEVVFLSETSLEQIKNESLKEFVKTKLINL